MTKKLAAFRVEPEVQRQLRILSAKRGMPIGEIIHGLILFAEKTQMKDTIFDSLPPQIRELFQFFLEGWFNGSMMEAREATRQAKIDNLTPKEQAEIMARHEENERKIQEAFKAAGIPWPDEEEGELIS